VTVKVRRPAVAGAFYPSDPDALRRVLADLLREAGEASGPVPKAVVVPHAGYEYSGPVAATAYARLLPLRGQVERAVLVGPAHWKPATAVAASSADAFQTPLGAMAVDREARDQLVRDGLAIVDDAAQAREHSLEVQIPFLQVVLRDVLILPLVVGRVPAASVTAVLDRFWNRADTVVIVSTDLSHYHDHHTAQRLDRRTAEAVVEKRPEDLGVDDACGVFALRGLVCAACDHDLAIELLDLRTSADTAGGTESVVGYGAFAVHGRE
jgi:AmmeMemoRadiSam system protein B